MRAVLLYSLAFIVVLLPFPLSPSDQDMEAYPIDGVDRYLTPCVALFEVVDDDLLPLKPVGIQVK